MTDDLDQAVVGRVVGWGLAGDPGSLGPVVLDDEASCRLRLWADQTRLDGALWAAHEAGAVVLTPGEADLLREAHVRAQHRSLACEARAAEVSELLASHGIESRVLKGLAAGRLDSPDPALRTVGDVDLLVRRREFGAALDVLAAAGHRRVELAPARWWERRYGRAATLKGAAGMEIDVHASIAVGYFGVRLDHDTLFEAGSEPIDLGGITVQALAGPARLLASCYAVVLSRGIRHRLWRDVVLQVRGAPGRWQDAADLAARFDGEAVVAGGLLAAAEGTGAMLPDEALTWARSVRPSARAARALAFAEAGEEEGWRADARSTLLALGPWDRALFLAVAGLHRVGRPFRRRVDR
jgi:hypothetical protein